MSLHLDIELYYRDITAFQTFYFEPITLNDKFLADQSEASGCRPYTSSNIISETLVDEYNQDIEQKDPDEYENVLQKQTIPHESKTQDQQPNAKTLQNLSDPSAVTTDNQLSLTITSDSIIFDVPVRQITQNENNNPNEYGTSTSFTSNTNTTQQLQTQQTPPRNYYPPSIPPLYSTLITPHNSPEQGSSNSSITNTILISTENQFQITTPTRQPILL